MENVFNMYIYNYRKIVHLYTKFIKKKQPTNLLYAYIYTYIHAVIAVYKE